MTGLEPFVAPLVSIMLDVLKDSGRKEGEGLIARLMKRDVGKGTSPTTQGQFICA